MFLFAMIGGWGVGAAEPVVVDRFHFKTREQLAVDGRRIAVLAPDRGAGEVAGMIPGADAEPSLKDWWLITLPVGHPRGVLDTAVVLSRTPGVKFAAPVLLGPDGHEVFAAPDLFVRWEAGVRPEMAARIIAESGAGMIVAVDEFGMPGLYRVAPTAADGASLLAVANDLARRPDVRFAEPDWVFTGRGAIIPSDPGFADCWGLHNTGQSGGLEDADMDCPEAWDVTLGDPSIVVVVLDVGVQQDHPDINQAPGRDFTGEGGDGGPVNSCDNHGTPVAGCVSAAVNGAGTVGAAPACRVASARVFVSGSACDGGWSSAASWTADALNWARTSGARVTNNSNTYGFTSALIRDAYETTRDAGLVHFACAGNDGRSGVAYPARLPSVNAVAALERHGRRASFSNWGTALDFIAPGEDIYTTDRTGEDGWEPGDYVLGWGTSFASPYAAGVAALVLSRNPALTASEVEAILAATATDLGPTGFDTDYGWGIPNALGAVEGARRECGPDCDDSGDLSANDYVCFQSEWRRRTAYGDYNGDGKWNVNDFIAFQAEWRKGC